MPRAHIAILVPSDDQWQAPMAVAVNDMVRFSMMNGVDVGIVNWRGATVSKARNGLVQLVPTGADAVLWVDSDIVMPPDALLRLLDHDKDIVGCLYNKRVPPYETVGRLKDPGADISKGGLHEADYLPGGFVMVKSKVYQSMKQPYYFETHRWPGDAVESFVDRLRDEAAVRTPDEAIAALMSVPAFTNWIEENHTADVALRPEALTSEDVSFCYKARHAGYQLWADLDLTFQLVHLAQVPVACLKPETKS